MSRILAFVGLLLLCGCTTNTRHMYSSVNGRTTEVYTPFYDCGDWLRNPAEIGIIAAAKHDKPVSVLYGLQRYLGALPPSDFDAQAIDFRMSPANYSKTEIKLRIVNVLNAEDNNASISVNKTFVMNPRDIEVLDLPPINISNFGTQIKLTINYEINDVPGAKDITLKRRTKSELKKIRKTNHWGYPWNSMTDE